MWLKDVRPEVTLERTYATKFMANHYLSWNVSNRLNLGFFESVICTNDRGFDASFINPIVSTGQLSLHLQRGREMRYGANI
jgi:hypothetical protein